PRNQRAADDYMRRRRSRGERSLRSDLNGNLSSVLSIEPLKWSSKETRNTPRNTKKSRRLIPVETASVIPSANTPAITVTTNAASAICITTSSGECALRARFLLSISGWLAIDPAIQLSSYPAIQLSWMAVQDGCPG